MVIEPNKPTFGLRLIAVFEAVKGILGLAIGFGLQALAMNSDHRFIRWIVENLRLTNSAHVPHFISHNIRDMLAHPGEYHLELYALIFIGYAALRFVEAYGLWLARRWGEWLALVSASLYLPFEIYAIVQHVHPVKIALLVLNIALVVYLTVVFIATRRKRALAATASATGAMEPQAGR
jgi:uncharacterized membrane protein (DUF2068 family)